MELVLSKKELCLFYLPNRKIFVLFYLDNILYLYYRNNILGGYYKAQKKALEGS
jgi:hypothetical protein